MEEEDFLQKLKAKIESYFNQIKYQKKKKIQINFLRQQIYQKFGILKMKKNYDGNHYINIIKKEKSIIIQQLME